MNRAKSGALFGVQVTTTGALTADVDTDVLGELALYEEYAKEEAKGKEQPRGQIVTNMLRFALGADPNFKKFVRKKQQGTNGNGNTNGHSTGAATRHETSTPPPRAAADQSPAGGRGAAPPSKS